VKGILLFRRFGRFSPWNPIRVFCGIILLFSARSAYAEPPSVIGEPATRVAVGPGSAESSIRQIVRTPAGYVYIAAADDQGGAAEGFKKTSYLRMYKSTTAGIPVAFKEVNRARHPRASKKQTFSGGDMRLDRNGMIHLVYYRTADGATIYQLFDTHTDKWDAASTVVTTFSGRPGRVDYGSRGRALNSIALDREGTPYVAVGGDEGVKVFRKTIAGWVEDAILSSAPALHPTLTFDRVNRLHIAWLDSPGHDSTIQYAMREATGVWGLVELVFPGDTNVLSHASLDQSPSLAVDNQNQPVVLYLSGDPGQPNNFVQTRTLTAGLWIADDPPSIFAHSPGLYIRNDVKFILLGHDGDIHPGYLTHRSTEPEWSTVVSFQPDEPAYQYDGSASARYDPQYEVDCSVVDVVYFDEASDLRGGLKPDLYYTAIKLNGAASGEGSCRELLP
jgi:hypothetical protein